LVPFEGDAIDDCRVAGRRLDAQAFQGVYRVFNQAEFHSFTSDNQDYLAYVCLMVLAGVVDSSRLAQAIRQGALTRFEQFIDQMDGRQDHRRFL
jgi:hypothetical protein